MVVREHTIIQPSSLYQKTIQQRTPALEENIADPAQIRSRLRELIANKSVGLLRNQRGSSPSIAQTIEAFGVLQEDPCPMQWKTPQPPHASSLLIDLEGYNALYRFEIKKWEWRDELLHTEVPQQVRYIRHRKAPRAEATPELKLRMQYPGPGEWLEDLVVKDLSAEGFGCWLPANATGLHHGAEFE